MDRTPSKKLWYHRNAKRQKNRYKQTGGNKEAKGLWNTGTTHSVTVTAPKLTHNEWPSLKSQKKIQD